MLTACCLSLWLFWLLLQLPACRYSLGLEPLSHFGGPRGALAGPGGLTEKPLPPLLLLQRRLRQLLFFGAAPTESLSFSCHPRFRAFFLPFFSGAAPPLQQQQQQTPKATAAVARGADLVAAKRQSLSLPQQQRQHTAAAAAAHHAQGFRWWRGLFNLAGAAQLVLLLLLLLLHADMIHRAAAPEEWSIWMAPMDAAAAAAARAAEAKAETSVAAAAAPFWGPAWLAVVRLQHSSSAAEWLILMLPMMLPVMLRFAMRPLGIWGALRGLSLALVETSASLSEPDLLSSSAESPSGRLYGLGFRV